MCLPLPATVPDGSDGVTLQAEHHAVHRDLAPRTSTELDQPACLRGVERADDHLANVVEILEQEEARHLGELGISVDQGAERYQHIGLIDTSELRPVVFYPRHCGIVTEEPASPALGSAVAGHTP